MDPQTSDTSVRYTALDVGCVTRKWIFSYGCCHDRDLDYGQWRHDGYDSNAWSSSTSLLEMKMNLKKKRILLSLMTIQKCLNMVRLDFFYV